MCSGVWTLYEHCINWHTYILLNAFFNITNKCDFYCNLNGALLYASLLLLSWLQLALKHRQGKNHRTRIVVFIGSPVEEEEKDLVKLAKRLKKEKVNVDIVNFGEQVSWYLCYPL